MHRDTFAKGYDDKNIVVKHSVPYIRVRALEDLLDDRDLGLRCFLLLFIALKVTLNIIRVNNSS
jgi:hypothetical protein